MTELSFDEYLKNIPTITNDEKPIVLAMYCTDQLRPTQLREMKSLRANSEACLNEKFPESIPVLYLLSEDNCNLMSEWDDIHEEVIVNPSSRVTILKGGHYLHLDNREGVVEAIRNFANQ